MFLTGPGVVREVMGEDVDAQELGGPKVHEKNGVCQFVAGQRSRGGRRRARTARPPAAARRRARRRTGCPRRCRRMDPAGARAGAARQVYDVRDVIRAIVDNGELLEVSARWARNMVTAFCRIDGRAGRRDRQPALVPRRRDRRRRGAEGRQVRAHLQLVRGAARGARRHARLPARHQAGGARRDPPRREAAARVRRGGRAEGHRRAAQGLRRRLHLR